VPCCKCQIDIIFCKFYNLFNTKRQIEKSGSGCAVNGNALIIRVGGGMRTLIAQKVLRKCPLVLPVKAGWQQGDGKWTLGIMQLRIDFKCLG
jgi:hypothetical protein